MALSIRLAVFINHYAPILCRRSTYGLTNQKRITRFSSLFRSPALARAHTHSFPAFISFTRSAHIHFAAHADLLIRFAKAREAIIWKALFSLVSVLRFNHTMRYFNPRRLMSTTTRRAKRQKL